VNYPLAGDINIKDILHYNWPNPEEIAINEELSKMAKFIQRNICVDLKIGIWIVQVMLNY